MQDVEVKPVHSPIGASSMHRWANCPGSVALSQNIPSKTSEAASLGTLAHEIADKFFQTGILAHENKALVQSAKKYVSFILKNTKTATYKRSEVAFDLKAIHPNLYGRCDYVAYFARKKILRVYDFKNGQSPVDPEQNDQLLYYALGAVINFPQFKIREIELVIVQPNCKTRSKTIRKWRFDAFEVMLPFAIRLKNAAIATEQTNAPLSMGSWCFWCPASFKCPLKQKEREEKAKNIFANLEDF